MNTDSSPIVDLIRRYETACNTRNVALFRELLAIEDGRFREIEDHIDEPFDREVADSILEWIEAHPDFEYRVRYHDIEAFPLGDTAAYAVARYGWASPVGEGTGRATFVCVRDAERWRILHGHWSASPVPEDEKPDAEGLSFEIHIAGTAEAIWRVLTDPAEASRVFPGSMRSFGRDNGEPAVGDRIVWGDDAITFAEGEIIEIEEPWHLVHTFRFVAEAGVDPARERPARFEYVLGQQAGITRVGLELSGFAQGSAMRAYLATGMPYVLSNIKSLVETGRAMEGLKVEG